MNLKRTLVSFVLFVVLFASLAAASGFGKEPTTELPEQWTMPATRHGDQGTYVAFQVEGDEVFGPVPFLDWERLDRDVMVDRHGMVQDVDPVRLVPSGWSTRDETTWEYGPSAAWLSHRIADSDDLVAFELELLDGAISYPDSSVDGLGLIEQRMGGDGLIRLREYVDPGDPLRSLRSCLVDHEVAGTTLSLDGPITLFDGCLMPFLPLQQGETLVEDPSPERIDDMMSGSAQFVASSKRFEPIGLSDDGELVLEQVNSKSPARVWLSSHVPYPLRVAIPDGEDRWDVFVLADFEEGSATPGQPPAVSPINLNTRQSAPMPYGLPDEGMGHPFLPSEAYAVALADEEIAAWFDNNPDARLTSLWGSHTRFTATNDHISWWFTYAAPGATHTFLVERDMSAPSRTTAPVTSLAIPDGEVTLKSAGQGALVPEDYLTAPMAAVPHAADLLDIFYGYAPDADGTEVWSLRLTCLNERGACQQAAWATEVGVAQISMDPAIYQDPAIATEIRIIDHGLSFSLDDGLPVSMVELNFEAFSTTGAGTPDAAPPSTELEPASTEVSWQLPGTATLVQTGGAAAFIAILYWLWPTLKATGLGMFSRIRSASVLEHPARQELHDAIASEPGIHFQELARRAGLGHGATDHHLRKLVETRQVVRHESSGYACYFPAATDRRVMAAAPALRSGTARRTLAAVAAQPGINGGELATAIGVNRGTVSHHVKRLLDAGVLEATRAGRTVSYDVTELGRKLASSRVAS